MSRTHHGSKPVGFEFNRRYAANAGNSGSGGGKVAKVIAHRRERRIAKRLLPFLGILLLCSAAFAVDPVAVVTGKKLAKTGDLIVLSSHESTPDTRRKWTVWPELTGTASQVNENLERWAASLREHGATVIMPSESDDGNSIAIEGDSKLVLASYPGVYRVMLAVSNADGLAVAKWTVTVSAAAPPPDAPDPPDEPDPPPPSPPAVTFGLAPEVPKWLETVPEANRSQKAALRTALATVGNQAVAGQLTTIDSVKVASGTAIKNSGIDLTAWRTFGTSMNAAFDGLIATGKIANGSDYGRAMIEVAGRLTP